MMAEPTNKDRAGWGRETFEAYPLAHQYEDDLQTQLVDLLADLMHFAKEEELDFEEAMRRAEGHYSFEEED
jgi:hypothetical protein